MTENENIASNDRIIQNADLTPNKSIYNNDATTSTNPLNLSPRFASTNKKFNAEISDLNITIKATSIGSKTSTVSPTTRANI